MEKIDSVKQNVGVYYLLLGLYDVANEIYQLLFVSESRVRSLWGATL